MLSGGKDPAWKENVRARSVSSSVLFRKKGYTGQNHLAQVGCDDSDSKISLSSMTLHAASYSSVCGFYSGASKLFFVEGEHTSAQRFLLFVQLKLVECTICTHFPSQQ